MYVSFDLDVLDPAFAPGVSHHEPGGISTREALGVLQALAAGGGGGSSSGGDGWQIVGADLVELNPPRDVDGVTAMVGAKILKEIMGVSMEMEDTQATASPTAPVSVVYCTVPSQNIGTALSNGLLNSSLAACVNIVPGVQSHFVWEGKLETVAEDLLVLKTASANVPALTAWLQQNHPYDEPEVIAIPVTGGSQSYLDWVVASTSTT